MRLIFYGRKAKWIFQNLNRYNVTDKLLRKFLKVCS